MTAGSRRVLVTGGAGFIGSHVAAAYASLGDRVWIVDDLSSGRRENVPEDVEFVEMDVCSSGVVDLFREVRFHIVNHHAAQIDVRASVDDPCADARVNVVGLLNLAEAALECGSERFLFVSSGGVVYGEAVVRPTPESAPKAPLSPYGVSKLAGEHYLHYYRAVGGLSCVSLRYANVYGPRQDPHGEAGVIAIFSKRLLEGRPLTIYGDGEQTRDYVFVEDVVKANLRATELSLDAGHDRGGIDAVAFNVGSGVGTSVNRLASLLERVAGVRVERDHRPASSGELRHSALDATRLERFGWTAATPLEDGLHRTFRDIARTEGTVV